MLSRLRRLLTGEPAPAGRPSVPPSAAPTATPPRREAAPVTTPAAPSAGPSLQSELLLYKYDACPYCRRVQRRIAELGIIVPTRDTRTDPAASGELYRQTGRTQVPCLFIHGEPLFESADIIEWLEQAAAAPRAQ
jgi:glutaredoxin